MKHALKKLAGTTLITAAVWLPIPAQAADRLVYQPLQDAVKAALAAGKIDDSVQFYLAGTRPARKADIIQRGVVTNKKTNAFAKKDESACLHVAQSAVIALHQSAKQAGANAVVNIVSYFRKKEYSNATNYECHAGNVVAGVALRGDFAKLK